MTRCLHLPLSAPLYFALNFMYKVLMYVQQNHTFAKGTSSEMIPTAGTLTFFGKSWVDCFEKKNNIYKTIQQTLNVQF